MSLLTYESDTEPYAIARDKLITAYCSTKGIRVSAHCSHTLFDPRQYVDASAMSGFPKSYQGFNTLFDKLGAPRKPEEAPTSLPSSVLDVSQEYSVPSLEEMGYPTLPRATKFPGGETEALRRFSEMVLSRPGWVASFDKPNSSPNSLEPSTTVLSPYLKFGCISVSLFWHTVMEINSKHKGHTVPPVSLIGQLMWREYFYANSVAIPNFDKMINNPQVFWIVLSTPS